MKCFYHSTSHIVSRLFSLVIVLRQLFRDPAVYIPEFSVASVTKITLYARAESLNKASLIWSLHVARIIPPHCLCKQIRLPIVAVEIAKVQEPDPSMGDAVGNLKMMSVCYFVRLQLDSSKNDV